MELSDGMYCLKSRVDEDFVSLLENGTVYAGMKLSICNGVLQELQDPCPPLEVSSAVHLKVNTNCIRRATSERKLGVQTYANFKTSLASLSATGGPASGLDLIVFRKYALHFVETGKDGRYTYRNQKDEDIATHLYQSERQKALEQIVGEFEQSGDYERKLVYTILKSD